MEGYVTNLHIWHKPSGFRLMLKIDSYKVIEHISQELIKLEGAETDIKIWLTAGYSVDNPEALKREKIQEHKLTVDHVMQTIPEEWRHRWCGAENGSCACMGCVQIGNRLIMAKKVTGSDYKGDPEHIDESKIPMEIYEHYKITREDWEQWNSTQSGSEV